MAAAAPATAGGAATAEDKDEFTIILVSAGDKKINVIKKVRRYITRTKRSKRFS